MAKKQKSGKPLLLNYTDHRSCKCGTEYDVTDSLNLDTGHYSGGLHECPNCGSEFDYVVTRSNFKEQAKKMVDGLEDWREDEMVSEVTSAKRVKKLLRLYIK
jgi:hypothetical protein